jgi:cysteine desulfurase
MLAIIYLDNHSSTPCDPRVVEAMLPYFTEAYANPSNALHVLGRRAADAVEEARCRIASLIGASPREIVFTSGATESNNLAILGLAKRADGARRKIVTSPIEHKSVIEAAKHLTGSGFEITFLPVDATGTVSIKAAEELIDDQTLLVSVQAANNEIGTIQPIAEISAIAHARGAVFHSDAAQAAGKIALDVDCLGVDLLSISAHKLYGPKGVGAVYVRGGASTKRLAPLFHGGGQERDLRPGTLNVPGIVGLGQACALCAAEMHEEARRIGQLRDRLEEELLRAIPDLRRNGNLTNRLPGNSSLTFPGVEADALLLNVPELALSTGSACTSGAPEPSHVLTAVGLPRDLAHSTIRVGLGRFNTATEIHTAAILLRGAYHRLVEAEQLDTSTRASAQM